MGSWIELGLEASDPDQQVLELACELRRLAGELGDRLLENLEGLARAPGGEERTPELECDARARSEITCGGMRGREMLDRFRICHPRLCRAQLVEDGLGFRR